MTDPRTPPVDDVGSPTGPDPDELPDDPPDLRERTVFEEDPAEYEDLNEFVEAEWAETKTGRQRVRAIASRASTPLSVSTVAELAGVSKPTARSQLTDLEAEGIVLAESTANGSVYRRDPDWYRLKRIRRLAEKSQTDLESSLQRLEVEIAQYEEKYEHDSPEELVLSDSTLDREGWDDISQWRTAIVDREYLRTALRYRVLTRYEEYVPESSRNENEGLNIV